MLLLKKKKLLCTHTHKKKLYPFVHIVSVTFDHIPRKSACHSVWLWDKRCSYLQTVIELRGMIRLTYVNFVFSSYLPLMFLFSKLLLMLELVSLFSLDIHYHRLSGCLCFCEYECLKAWKQRAGANCIEPSTFLLSDVPSESLKILERWILNSLALPDNWIVNV